MQLNSLIGTFLFFRRKRKFSDDLLHSGLKIIAGFLELIYISLFSILRQKKREKERKKKKEKKERKKERKRKKKKERERVETQ